MWLFFFGMTIGFIVALALALFLVSTVKHQDLPW